MFVRVVRFSDVTRERADATLARIEESGPPPGISIARIQMIYNENDGTAVVLQHFETAEDMEASAPVFAAMDPSETPGTRSTVDTGELKLDICQRRSKSVPVAPVEKCATGVSVSAGVFAAKP